MTLPEIANQRLINQQISQTTFRRAPELVAWLGAVQAQEYALTKWSLGLRLPESTDAAIEQAFTDGSLLRTHVLRPTWHFVAAEDIRWMLQLTSARVKAANAYMYRKLELDAAFFNRCTDVLISALQSGKQRTRSALNEALKQHGIQADGLRLSYVMMQAELDGILCSGARQGNQFTYALLDERVPAVRALTHEEALAELATRYFTSRGPATVADFSTWSGLTVGDCKRGVALVNHPFVQERVTNEVVYVPTPRLTGQTQPHDLYLVPMYDELIMGYKDRAAMMAFRDSLNPKPQFRFNNTIVLDGQFIGTWKRTVNKTSMDLAYQFFRPPNQNQVRLFERAVLRLGEFTKLTVNYERTDEPYA